MIALNPCNVYKMFGHSPLSIVWKIQASSGVWRGSWCFRHQGFLQWFLHGRGPQSSFVSWHFEGAIWLEAILERTPWIDRVGHFEHFVPGNLDKLSAAITTSKSHLNSTWSSGKHVLQLQASVCLQRQRLALLWWSRGGRSLTLEIHKGLLFVLFGNSRKTCRSCLEFLFRLICPFVLELETNRARIERRWADW